MSRFFQNQFKSLSFLHLWKLDETISRIFWAMCNVNSEVESIICLWNCILNGLFVSDVLSNSCQPLQDRIFFLKIEFQYIKCKTAKMFLVYFWYVILQITPICKDIEHRSTSYKNNLMNVLFLSNSFLLIVYEDFRYGF